MPLFGPPIAAPSPRHLFFFFNALPLAPLHMKPFPTSYFARVLNFLFSQQRSIMTLVSIACLNERMTIVLHIFVGQGRRGLVLARAELMTTACSLDRHLQLCRHTNTLLPLICINLRPPVIRTAPWLVPQSDPMAGVRRFTMLLSFVFKTADVRQYFEAARCCPPPRMRVVGCRFPQQQCLMFRYASLCPGSHFLP